MKSINTDTKEVMGVLYDSFVLRFSLNDRYERFGAGIEIGNGVLLTMFLGEYCSLNNNDVDIKNSLDIIDNYCRQRLPDKFLIEYDKAYKNKI